MALAHRQRKKVKFLHASRRKKRRRRHRPDRRLRRSVRLKRRRRVKSGLRQRRRRRRRRPIPIEVLPPIAAVPEPEALPPGTDVVQHPEPNPPVPAEPAVEPIRTYPAAVDWVNRNREQGGAPYYAELHPEPIGSAYVTVIPGGSVWGSKGRIYAPDDALIEDVSIDYSPEGPPAEEGRRSLPVHHIPGTAAVLTFFSSHTYFHWLFDVIARLDLIERSGIRTDTYVFNSVVSPFQEEILGMLGIPPGRRIYTQDAAVLRAEQLLVPSIPMHGYLEYPRWPFDYVRKALTAGRQWESTGNDKLYISRGGALLRKVYNEPELEAMLNNYGFVSCQLERLSVAEQIRLFQSARLVVAPHGSGLSNLVFCKPGAQVIELFAEGYTPNCYGQMCAYGGLNYESVICQGYESQHYPWSLARDMTVDLRELRTKVEQRLKGGSR